MKKEKFRPRKFLNKEMRDCIAKDKMPSLRLMRVTGNSFSNNLIFVDCLVTFQTGIRSEIVLTMSPTTANYLSSALKKELDNVHRTERRKQT